MKINFSINRHGFSLFAAVVFLFTTVHGQAQLLLTNYLYKQILTSGAAHALMLKSDGTVWAWGFGNSYGQLGGSMGQMTPISPITNILGATAVAAGDYFSL